MSSKSPIVAVVEEALHSGDAELLRPVLAPRVRWGDCVDADAVVMTMGAMLAEGAAVISSEFTELDDRIVAALHVDLGGEQVQVHQALLVDEGQIQHVIDAPDFDTASTVAPSTDPAPGSGSSFDGLAVVLPVRDVSAAMAHYTLLGFGTRSYDGGYGYAERGNVSLHLAGVADLDPLTTTSAVYLFVGDAAAVHAEWLASGAAGRFSEPQATPYGLLEGAHIDPDGNLLRYGSSL